MEAMEKIEVNGRQYSVTMFDPITAFEFCHDYGHARANGGSMKGLGRKAFSQCIDPNMRSLSDIAHFQEWFSKHPEDMIPVELAAIEALIAPFVRSVADTMPTGTN